MKQILVASDFSKSAANAMEYALGLAKVLRMDICVIHAIHPTEGIDNNIYNAIFIEDYYNNKRQALKNWVAEHTDKDTYQDVEVSTLCGVGFLKNVIGKYTEENKVELLVMGITGSTGIAGIVGSNVSIVVSKMKIPTLIIPLESKFSKVPTITLATDYETRLSAEDVKALNEMIRAFGSEKMQVLYVVEKSDSRYLKTREDKLRDLVTHAELEFNYINDSKPLNGIMEFVEQQETDLLCLVKHHHNIVYRLFNKSTVNQVMNRSVKAILVLHE
ncbi:universal stress protein [Mucilaginibacter dorajii]|uniref:UspA domain-containing protein n=1 Tax=Mucilaginibacter dorajii TaxID=692994 RepID=A0ABP7P745_9SPHI|nr:universal stress protein [Mucilaginibacter dorajii]MCS3734455.1 nucleotide-binding universal stress UspA family protein [Mucilaginibacter dorajii]